MNENAKNRLLWTAAIAFFAVILVYRLAIVISYKQELINGESNNIWNAMNVAHGKALYSNPEDLPLEVFQYTPLAQLPIVFFAKLFDAGSPDYVYHISLMGRLFALLFNLFSAYIVSLFLHELFATNKFSAFLGGLLFFSTLTHPNFAIRPDPLLILANVSLAYGFSLALLKGRNKILYLLSFLVGLSMLIKQDGFFIMGPVGLFLLLYGRWKDLIFSSLIFIAGVFLFFCFAHLLFGEHFFYSVTRGIQMNSSLSQAISVFDRALSLYGFQFSFSLIVACYFLIFKREDQKIVLLSLFVLVYMFFGFASSFKPGSWVNYYTFCILFGSVLLVHFFHNHIKTYNSGPFLLVLVLLVGGIFWFRQVYVYTMPYLKFAESKKEYRQVFSNSVEIKSALSLGNEDHIIVGNPLLRNFLFKNSVMVNTEYYGISNFNYYNYRTKEDKHIEYIVTSVYDEGTIDFLCKMFNLNRAQFIPLIEIGNFIILKNNGILP